MSPSLLALLFMSLDLQMGPICGILTVVEGMKSQGISRENCPSNYWDNLNVYLDKVSDYPFSSCHKYMTKRPSLWPMPQPFLSNAPSLTLALSASLLYTHPFLFHIKGVSCARKVIIEKMLFNKYGSHWYG